jgi:hypothetical protein
VRTLCQSYSSTNFGSLVILDPVGLRVATVERDVLRTTLGTLLGLEYLPPVQVMAKYRSRTTKDPHRSPQGFNAPQEDCTIRPW